MKKYEIKLLSSLFYEKYNNIEYPEIEDKATRPFLVLLVFIDGNRFAIPFRSNIGHQYCYKFSSSNRETKSKTALDFSKAVIINDDNYLGEDAYIDKKEFIELSSKYIFIINKFQNFLKKYKRIICNPEKYKYEFDLLSNYCTLKYFRKELNIDTDK